MTLPTADDNRRGIIAILAAMALFAVNDTLIKLASGWWPAHQIMAIRGIFASALILLLVLRLGDGRMIGTVLRPMVLVRSIMEAIVAFTYITALKTMPLADISAILLVSPFLITAASVLLFGESVGWRRWAAITAGFAGAMLVVKPSMAGVSWDAGLALASAAGVAVRDLITRRLSAGVPTSVIALGTTLCVMLAGVIGAIGGEWKPLAWPPMLYVIGAAGFLAAGNYYVVVAFRGVDIGAVAPFRYSIVLWASALGLIVFRQTMDGLSLAGTVLIVGAGLYSLHRERLRARDPAA